MEKLTSGLSGIAGEYFVAAELTRRGFMASVTLRNSDSIDIHASKNSGNNLYAIQVKTNQNGRRAWPLSSKCELLKAPNLFYVFVSLKKLNERPDYFIVSSECLSERVKAGHAEWLATPGKKGQPHNDTPIRQFHDIDGEFLERWDLLS